MIDLSAIKRYLKLAGFHDHGIEMTCPEIEKEMKKYAKLMCEEQREICAESANIQINTGTGIDYYKSFSSEEYPFHESFINLPSILNSPLPEELQNG